MSDEPQIQSAGEPVHIQQQPAVSQPVGQDVINPQVPSQTPKPDPSSPPVGLPIPTKSPEPKASDKVKLGKPNLPKKEKAPNTMAAIIATVIIVLGLAVLAVLAYI